MNLAPLIYGGPGLSELGDGLDMLPLPLFPNCPSCGDPLRGGRWVLYNITFAPLEVKTKFWRPILMITLLGVK